MNVVSSRGGHPPLRDEEALVVETAVRLAIDSIINVLHGVHGAHSREHQRTVADRDKEIRRLEGRLTQLEQELQRRGCHGCTCGVYGAGPGPLGPPRGVRSSAANQQEGQVDPQPGCRDPDMASDQQQCEMNISFGLFSGPPSHASSPSRLLLLDQSCSSRASSAVSGVTVPTSPGSLLVKEEPCDIDAVLIKWEMSEERGGGVDGARSPCQHVESHNEKRKLSSMQKEEEQEEENPESAPGGVTQNAEEELRLEVHRNKKRSVPMSELPEEAQRLKRAAWRAASRRYYARKVARQQANPSRRGAFTHITNSVPVPPVPSGSFMERRRATLISQLPEESQTLQREAWRASSRRYYARKIARHQAQAAPYRHMPEDANPSGDVRGPEGGGAHSGGILCS